MSGIIRMSRFGKMGRFGNQILQMLFLQTYALRYGLSIEIPPWVGDDLFMLDIEPKRVGDNRLYEFHENGGIWSPPEPPEGRECINCDFVGYAQFHTSYYKEWKRNGITALFATQSGVADPYIEVETMFDEHTTIGIHLRRGDYGQLFYYITPVEWYLDVLRNVWANIKKKITKKKPLLFVSSEDPSLVYAFKEFNPVTTASLGIEVKQAADPRYAYLQHDLRMREPHQLDFYTDFRLLSRCDYMFIPNSTFSFAAALLNPKLRRLYRSSLPQQRFIEIKRWDSRPLEFDYVQDFPDVPGVALETNPYWHNQPGGRALRRP